MIVQFPDENQPNHITSTREKWRGRGKRNLGLGEYWLQVKANLDVERDWELPDLSNAKMLSCGEKKIVGNSQLKNYESYTGQLTSMFVFFFLLADFARESLRGGEMRSRGNF